MSTVVFSGRREASGVTLSHNCLAWAKSDRGRALDRDLHVDTARDRGDWTVWPGQGLHEGLSSGVGHVGVSGPTEGSHAFELPRGNQCISHRSRGDQREQASVDRTVSLDEIEGLAGEVEGTFEASREWPR
jgi:hypothetical protein